MQTALLARIIEGEGEFSQRASELVRQLAGSGIRVKTVAADETFILQGDDALLAAIIIDLDWLTVAPDPIFSKR